MQGRPAPTVCFPFYALFLSFNPQPHLSLFLNLLSSPSTVFSSNHLSFSSEFLCLLSQTPLNLALSLSVLFALLFNPAGNHMNMLNATSSSSHLEVSALPGACSLGLIFPSLYSQQACVFPLFICLLVSFDLAYSSFWLSDWGFGNVKVL